MSRIRHRRSLDENASESVLQYLSYGRRWERVSRPFLVFSTENHEKRKRDLVAPAPAEPNPRQLSLASQNTGQQQPPTPPGELEDAKRAERSQRRKSTSRIPPGPSRQDVRRRQRQFDKAAHDDQGVEHVELVLCILPRAQRRELAEGNTPERRKSYAQPLGLEGRKARRKVHYCQKKSPTSKSKM